MVDLWCTLLQVFSYRCSLKTKSFMKCIIGSLSIAILIKLKEMGSPVSPELSFW